MEPYNKMFNLSLMSPGRTHLKKQRLSTIMKTPFEEPLVIRFIINVHIKVFFIFPQNFPRRPNLHKMVNDHLSFFVQSTSYISMMKCGCTSDWMVFNRFIHYTVVSFSASCRQWRQMITTRNLLTSAALQCSTGQLNHLIV